MVPALRVLPGQIKPHRSRPGPGPVYGASQRRGVEGAEVFADLRPDKTQQVAEQARADPARRLHPGVVQLIDQGDQLRPTPGRLAGRLLGVPLAGEQADIAAQQVHGDVLHRPLGTDCERAQSSGESSATSASRVSGNRSMTTMGSGSFMEAGSVSAYSAIAAERREADSSLY